MPILPQRGTVLLVLLLSTWLAFVLGRSVLPLVGEDAPAAVFSGGGIPIMLGNGFIDAGIHQFSDAITPADVINMTQVDVAIAKDGSDTWLRPLVPGERLDLVSGATGKAVLRRSFMAAEARMLVGIPLHPDRMNRADWQALPGIGEKLADTIENDRQKNGDFGSLEGLKRVKGIGQRRLQSWDHYFSEKIN